MYSICIYVHIHTHTHTHICPKPDGNWPWLLVTLNRINAAGNGWMHNVYDKVMHFQLTLWSKCLTWCMRREISLHVSDASKLHLAMLSYFRSHHGILSWEVRSETFVPLSYAVWSNHTFLLCCDWQKKNLSFTISSFTSKTCIFQRYCMMPAITDTSNTLMKWAVGSIRSLKNVIPSLSHSAAIRTVAQLIRFPLWLVEWG